jgi:CheY-like chemotaxis protein
MMPRVDGEAFYTQVARDYPFLADRFLFITGHAARRAGLTDFVERTGNSLLEKPFEIDQLRTALQELFARRR